MMRAPGLKEVMRKDPGGLPGLAEKPMFGGLCFPLHGRMICATLRGGAIRRVGKPRKAAAPIRGGRRRCVRARLDDHLLSDDATRARPTGRAMDRVRDLPPKE